MSYSKIQNGPKIINDGLILHLDAANLRSYPGSGTDWFDLTRYNNNGTLINGPTFDSIYGGTILFDGTDDYVDTINLSNLTPTTPLTLNVWVDNGSGPIIGTFVVDSSFNFSGVYMDSIGNGVPIFYFSDGTSASYNFEVTISLPLPPLLNFYNLSVTYDGSNDANGVKMYVNGIEKSTFIVNNTPLTGNPTYNIPWNVGTILYDSGTPPISPFISFNGKIAITQVYDRVLSQIEITQNYENYKSRFGLI